MIDWPCVDPGTLMPNDDRHIHVGSGVSEVSLEISPGAHTICVQIGDGFHTAVAIVDTIDIIVAPES